jgi:general secretion pathway protein D
VPTPAGAVPPPAGAVPPPVATPTPTPSPAPTPRAPGVVAVQPVTGAAAPTAAPPAQILLTVPAADMQVGGPPYTVPVSVTGVSDLGAATLTITYDPKVLKATSVSPGTFMQQGGVSPTFAPKIDEASGRIDIAVSRGANAPGAAGTGLLAGLVFQAVGPGSSKITVSATALTPGGQPITLQLPAAGSVTVK